MIEDSCRHFTGIQNERCEAGIDYKSVRHVSPKGMAQWPCICKEVRHLCASFEPYTAEEIAETERAIATALSSLASFMERETEDCPHCGQHVTGLRQIGRCVYAEPCGCRLWQGSIPKVWK